MTPQPRPASSTSTTRRPDTGRIALSIILIERAIRPAQRARARWAAALTRLWHRAEQNRRVPFFEPST